MTTTIDRLEFRWTCPTCAREHAQSHIQHIGEHHRVWWRCEGYGHVEVATGLAVQVVDAAGHWSWEAGAR